MLAHVIFSSDEAALTLRAHLLTAAFETLMPSVLLSTNTASSRGNARPMAAGGVKPMQVLSWMLAVGQSCVEIASRGKRRLAA